MKTFGQSPDNYDIVLDRSGQIAVVEGKAAYALMIEDAVRTIQGEYPFDTDLGVPYFSTVLGRSNGVEEWIAALQSRVLDFDFVSSIVSFDYSYIASEKTIRYNMTVLTDLGTVEISQ